MPDVNIGTWTFFGWKISKELTVFLFQVGLVYIVVAAALFNLCGTSCVDKELWIALLGSAVGYLMPNPSLKNG